MEFDTSKIDRYIAKGFDQKDWYDREAESLIELLPEFKCLPIIRCFAVTSMTTSIEANVHLAIKALLQLKNNKPFIGFLPNQKLYLELIKNGNDVPGRKIMNFIKALEGDVNSVVVDIWMCRAFDLIKERKLPNGRDYFRSPSKSDYDLIEDAVKFYSYLCAIPPRDMQAIIWSGIKREQGVTKNVSWSTLLRNKRGIFNY